MQVPDPFRKASENQLDELLSTGVMDGVMFPPESLRKCRDTLDTGRSVVIRVRAKSNDGEVRFFGDDAEPIEKVLEGVTAGLRVHVSPRSAEIEALKRRLEAAVAPRGGGGKAE